MAMHRIEILSSAVRSVGYDPATRTLETEFKNGRVYRYTGVPIELFASFVLSRSKGRFFNVALRSFYPYREIKPVAPAQPALAAAA